jgi:hypothetical protein
MDLLFCFVTTSLLMDAYGSIPNRKTKQAFFCINVFQTAGGQARRGSSAVLTVVIRRLVRILKKPQTSQTIGEFVHNQTFGVPICDCQSYIQVENSITNSIVLALLFNDHGDRIRPFSGGQTIAAGIFSLPELADSFRRFVQPVAVSQQGNQFNGTEEFHRIGPGLAVVSQPPAAEAQLL